VDLIEQIVDSHWFRDESPFRASFQRESERVCIITGPNASGKSLVRKLIAGRIDKGLKYMHFSQAGRTKGGIVRSSIYGDEQEDSTGYNTVKILTRLSRMESTGKCVILFDEPEIGCSEEVQAAIGETLHDTISNLPDVEQLFIITHSRLIVRAMIDIHPSHLRLSSDGMTLDQYVNRLVVPASLDRLVEQNDRGWRYVGKHTH